MRHQSAGDDPNGKLTQQQHDLALLFQTDLYVGPERLYKIKRKGTSLRLCYEIDGKIHQRSYLSAMSWRAILLFALSEGKTVTIHCMDQPGRYERLFPRTLQRRLQWYERPNANFPPAARLYDPNGSSVMLLTRSRIYGHAVDALHNLSHGRPVFQPLWVADIMALRPMLGIKLVRDESFAATMPISAYLEAAAKSGRIVEEPGLFKLPLTGKLPALFNPTPSKAGRSIFHQVQTNDVSLPILRKRTIFDDYSFCVTDPSGIAEV